MGKAKRKQAPKPAPQAKSKPKKIEFRLPDVEKDRQSLGECAREEIDELIGRGPDISKPLPQEEQSGSNLKQSNGESNFINPFPEEFKKPRGKAEFIEPEYEDLEHMNRESAVENLTAHLKVLKEVKGRKR
jgi:hypothetical protein